MTPNAASEVGASAGLTPQVKAEVTRLLHLAIVAQIQLWEATTNLEALLDGELVSGSQEARAARLFIDPIVQDFACYLDTPLPEVLAMADADKLLEQLAIYEADSEAGEQPEEVAVQ